MTPYYSDKWVTIYHGDCLDVLPQLDKASAIVTDPPYELGFMGKKWDSQGVSFQIETWRTIRNACKSGAMLLSFGGTRTFHRIACAIEDAGFEYRDTVMWVYGSGFPKSLDIGKAIDKHGGNQVGWFGQWLRKWRAEKGILQKQIAELFPSRTGGLTGCVANWELGFNLPTPEQFNLICRAFNLPFNSIAEAKREVIGKDRNWGDAGVVPLTGYKELDITAPATPESYIWNGYGTALKPAYEPIILGMNPLDRTFANNALKYGVAGLNIDECRVGTDKPPAKNTPFESWRNLEGRGDRQSPEQTYNPNEGRFPANFLHDGSDEVLELFPKTGKSSGGKSGHTGAYGGGYKEEYYKGEKPGFGDNGSASRFFYCAKASKSERSATNNHPTVKPLALMEYLCKLVKMPEYNIILDPFCGSGTTLLACMKLGIKAIGIDSDEQSCEIAAIRYLRSLND